MNELIKALRCKSGVGSECDKKCKYYSAFEIPEKMKSMADFESDCKYFVMNCDCDRIDREAADMLEKLRNEMYSACSNEMKEIGNHPAGEEKDKHAYAHNILFEVLMKTGIDNDYEEWQRKKDD